MGQHKNPRRKVTATEEQFATMDKAAAKAGLPWSQWVLLLAEEEACRLARKTSKKSKGK